MIAHAEKANLEFTKTLTALDKALYIKISLGVENGNLDLGKRTLKSIYGTHIINLINEVKYMLLTF